jgi:transposase
MVFVGVDWAEAHHDLMVLDEHGNKLTKGRVTNDLEGISRLHALLAEHAEQPQQVVVGIESDHGLLVQSLLAAQYQVYALNPLAVARYRDRHSSSGAKSDAGDAKVLADLVRTDRHLHRQMAGESELVDAIGVLARTHQNLIWTRTRHLLQLRSALIEYYPAALQAFAGELGGRDALAILALAPTPAQGQHLSRGKIRACLVQAGRQRNLEATASRVHDQLRQPQLQAPARLAHAHGLQVKALVAIIQQLNGQISELEKELTAHFEEHPDAEIYLSLPGLGSVLSARALAEFGDDPNRFLNPKARKNYAGTSPITRASGNRRMVLARFARNDRLADACFQWATCALRASPGAHQYYRQLRTRGKTHNQAIRALANRLVGILHGCLARKSGYSEEVAWSIRTEEGVAA